MDSLVLFPILGRMLSVLPLRIMFAVGLSYGLYYVEVGSFYVHFFLKSFNRKWVLKFFKGFFCICRDYHMVFIFQYFNMVYHIDWYAYIEESLHPWNKSKLIMCLSFLICCWTLFARILLRIFASMFISDIDMTCSFLF